MKKYLTAGLSALIMCAVTACTEQASEPSVTSKAAVSETETSVSETVSEPGGEETTAADTVYTDDGFYIYVSDFTGNMRTIYASRYDDGGYWVYMDEYTDDPDRYMGYRSITASDAAFTEKEFDLSDLKDIGHENLIIKFQARETLSPSSVSDFPEDDIAVIKELFQNIDPIYVSDEERESIEEEPDINELVESGKLSPNDTDKLHELLGFDPMRPLRSIAFADSSQKSYEISSSSSNHFEWTSYYEIELKNKNGKTYGRIWINDLSPMKKLITEGEITPDSLHKAYSQTTVSISDWFELGDSDLYNYSLNTVLRTPKNDFDRVNQYKSPKPAPSAGRLIPDDHDFAALGYVDLSTPDDYTDTAELMDIHVSLPEGGKTVKTDKMLIWTKDTTTLTIKYGGNNLGIFDLTGAAYGKHKIKTNAELPNSTKAQYQIYSRDDVGAWYINLAVNIGGSAPYFLSLRSTEETLTDEFTDTAKYVLGSLSMTEKTDLNTGHEHAAMRLSDTPSQYTDEGYKIIAAMSTLSDNSFTEYSPQPFFVFFYSLDSRKDLLTTKAYTLERLENGKWYEVMPIAEIYPKQESDHEIPFALGTDLNCAFGFDPNIYPLLSAGRYRLAIPFRENDENEYHGGFYEFEVTPSTEAPPHTAEAEAYVEDDRIICHIDRKELFFTGDYIDIEHYGENGWHSVRTAPIKSEDYSHYSIDLVSVVEKEIYRQDFDMTKTGRYRLRINICDEDSGDTGEPETVYAEFDLTDSM